MKALNMMRSIPIENRLRIINKNHLNEINTKRISSNISTQVNQDYDGSNVFNKIKSSVMLKSFLSPCDVFITESLNNVRNEVDRSFNDIIKYPDEDAAERWNQPIPTRYRKIRYIDGKQKIHNISKKDKTFGYNELSLDISDRDYYIQDLPTETNDFRKNRRYYKLIETNLILSNAFLGFINYVSLFAVSEYMFNYLYNDNNNYSNYNNKFFNNNYFEFEWEINLHFMRNIVSADGLKASNSPEGIHQDGEDLTFIGPVINRYNVDGGYNIMYDLNKNQLGDKFIIDEGRCLMFDDRTYYHYVTELNYKSDDNPNDINGFRDVVICGLSFKDPQLNRWNNTHKFM